MQQTIDMRKPSGCLMTIIAIIAVIAILAVAGRADYNEEVYSEMGIDTYRAIQAELGEGASESDIIDAYMARKR